jgi:L,D-transpeptidase catalytic domain
MRRLPGLLAAFAAAGLLGLALTGPARANLLITVDKNAQQMTITVDGDPRYIWPVATGIARYDTPDGQFQPFRMEREHYSREWDDAPMPYSIFFTKQGHAIHGTNHKINGAPASHGCVRLSVKHAAQLWALVKEHKMANTRVELTGDIPSKQELMARRETGKDQDDDKAADKKVADKKDTDKKEANKKVANATPDDTAPDEGVRDIPRVGRGWREYHEGGRTYYYRTGPREVQRVYRPVYRVYRRSGRGIFW